MNKTTAIHSPEWFERCFAPEGETIPRDLREFSQTMCQKFSINGTADPMYIVNVMAYELGRGTGRGEFHAPASDAKDQFDARRAKALEKLSFAYSSCIAGDKEGLQDLAREHLLPRPTA